MRGCNWVVSPITQSLSKHIGQRLILRPYPKTYDTIEPKRVKEPRMPRTRPWKVSDELWERVQPLIPSAPSHAKGGRPRMGDRQAFEAIVYVLRTGIQWNALPRELGASSTVHDRFQEWEQAGFFQALWQAEVQDYDELIGIQWEWQAVDGAMTKAPFGHAATGANPTDGGKQGT